jgi:4-hydroxy-tetrahydrodipicolinate reductase
MPRRPLRVIALGLGPVGQAVCREIADDPEMDLVGAVDPAPGLAGADLGKLLKNDNLAGIRVAETLAGLGRRRIDAAAHMAGSRFLEVLPHFDELIARKVHVVSTTEELIAASERWPAQARALDRKCRAAGVTILGTGINPGFLMDLMPAAMANVCVSMKSIRIGRYVDTSKRRRALQLKTGSGLTPAEFRRRAKTNDIGHVGCIDSLLFLMNHVPLWGEVEKETIRPVIAKKAIGKGKAGVAKGQVAGVHHKVVARDPGSRRIVATIELKMVRDYPDPHDEIVIDGDPSVRLRIENGIQGDRGTVGMVLSTLRYVQDAPAGFAV